MSEVKYHVNPETGEPGRCSATEGRCPFGGPDAHHGSVAAARSAYEASMVVFPTRVTASQNEETLRDLAVPDGMAKAILDAGFELPVDVEEELKKLPVYAGEKPEQGDFVRVTRRRYSSAGVLEETEVYEGFWQRDTDVDTEYGQSHEWASGEYYIRGLTTTEENDFERRIRSNGPTAFASHDSHYFEHDLIEVLESRGGADFEELTKKNSEELRERRRAERKAAQRGNSFLGRFRS